MGDKLSRKNVKEAHEKVRNAYQIFRAKKVSGLLNKYDKEDAFASVTDALADLMHYCEVHDLNYADAERIAEGHYIHERKKGDDA